MSSFRSMITAVVACLVLFQHAAADEKFDPTRDVLESLEAMRVGPLDWPQWGGSSRRNNTPAGTAIPVHWDVRTGENVLWSVPLGSQTNGSPVVANGKIFVGTNNTHGYVKRYPSQMNLGALIAFEEKTGAFLWQASTLMLATGRSNFVASLGNCSTPYCEGNRLWYVTGRAEVVCLDTEGFHDAQNDGPYKSESNKNRDEDDIVWHFDMMTQLGVTPHKHSSCSITCLGEYCFVITGNGVDSNHLSIPTAKAPSFICLNKSTGELIWSDSSPGGNILHGQWSSPCIFHAGGRDQVVMAGGDGWIYSFDPAGDGLGRAKLLWKFDGNPKAVQYSVNVGGTDQIRNPIVATPVFYDGYLYIGMGEDQESSDGAGMLYCIDPTREGDVSIELAVDSEGKEVPPQRLAAIDPTQGHQAIPNPNSALRWQYDQSDRNENRKIEFEEILHRTVSSVAIKNDLLIVPDLSGVVHCLDAKQVNEGKPVVYWTHDMFSPVQSSPLIVEDKVYICDVGGDVVVFELSKTHRVLAENRFDKSIRTTPIVANDTLYVASQNRLYALKSGANSPGSDARRTDETTVSATSNPLAETIDGPVSGQGSRPAQPPAREPTVEPNSQTPSADSSVAEPGSLKTDNPLSRLESADVLLVETKDGIAAYSSSLGKWDTLTVANPDDGSSRLKKATLSDVFASVVINQQIFGYSSKIGRWAMLRLPPEIVRDAEPVHLRNTLSVKIGDQIYVLSSRSGEWTSPDVVQPDSVQGGPELVAPGDAQKKLRLALDSAEVRRLQDEVAKYESRSTRQAEQIRQMLKVSPVGTPESDAIQDARQALEETLAKALDLKTQIEQSRLREMQARLSRMEEQLEQRKAQRTQIVKRRATELIEGEETRWSDPKSVPSVARSSSVRGSFSSSTLNRSAPILVTPKSEENSAKATSGRDNSTPASTPLRGEPVTRISAKPLEKKPNEFFSLSRDGSELKLLYQFEGHPLVGSPAVSHDGQWIAFDAAPLGNSDDMQIFVMPIDGGPPKRICSGQMPTWFPFGRYLLCTRQEPRSGIWRVDRESQERTFIRPGSGGQMSPDGTKVAVTFSPELTVLDLTPGTNRTIIGGRSNPFIHIVSNGTWSPDGKSFCFVGVRSNGARDICTTTMTGIDDIADLKVHHTFRQNVMTDFAWHPAGDRIVFSGVCSARKGLKQLYEFDPDKPGSVELVPGQDPTRNNFDMSWTPDGQRLIYLSGDYCDD
ncbi:PQQ-binding-like beta-propeller repeat protein [Schlesneria sp. T3-172]|uniref:outer membrane protein assembly factor BamB family protein n=1 Tax=Schlesneria sphaerica TaxID=3373610 RepID=UPI0037CACC3B